MSDNDNVPLIIEHRITKVNGAIGFKKYKREKLLGKGAFANCYQCVNLQSQKHYAIKAISKKTLDTDEKRQKALLEIKIHKILHHHNIVRFDSAFQDTDFIYIVQELCSGETLLDVMIKRGKVTHQQTKQYMLQIIQAVEYMHLNQIIHRDLKLANIFLDQNNLVKVGDFGEAVKLEFAEEKKLNVCGTLNYLAPEIVSGPFGHSYEIDLWAIGVMCFAMLFGKSPFQSKDENETYEKIQKCRYEFPSSSSVPSEAKDFIKKILVLDPKGRLTTKQMLSHPFLSTNENSKRSSLKTQFAYKERMLTVPSYEPGKEKQNKSIFMKLRSKSNLFQKIDNFVNNHPQRQPFITNQSLTPISISIDQFSSMKRLDQKQEKKLGVLSFIDLTKTYGFGYLLNNNIFGVYFNDGTVMSSDQQKEKVYFVKNPENPSATVEEYTSLTVPKDREFQKKYLLLDRFIALLRIESHKTSQKHDCLETFEEFVYVKEWWKNSQGTMFSLSNDQFQVSFTDGSQTVIQPEKQTISIRTKEGNRTSFDTIDEALNSSVAEIKKRAKYTKEIFSAIDKKKKKTRINTVI